MPEALAELSEIDVSEIERAVGQRSFQRGRAYALGDRVLDVEWDPEDATLNGAVLGQGALYSTSAYFEELTNGSLQFQEGDCSCPVGYNCKHVAAIVLAAIRAGVQIVDGESTAGRPAQTGHAGRPAEDLGSWERPLRTLLSQAAPRATGTPLAIELRLQVPAHGSPQLFARLMRPGARGGWVNGSLSFSGLDYWHVRSGDYREDHLALVRELYALHRARDSRSGYYYSAGADKALELSACDSPQLWSLLGEAARIGLALVHAHPKLGEVRLHRDGEVLLDVVADGDGGASMRAVVRVGGESADHLRPLLFLRPGGHGLICAERADIEAGREPEAWRLALVQLGRPAPEELQRLVLGAEPLRIPAGELERFATEICPALRHIAPVGSSDGSFTVPEVSGPELVLRASYGAGHAAELAWEWAYRIGEQERRVPLSINGGGPEFRDPEAEREILARADLSGIELERLGLIDPDTGRPIDRGRVELRGLEVMRLATEQLPRLSQRPGLEVEVTGAPADYRDVGDSLQIGVSTAEIAGERDWFDLGVSITVEGRELPFAEVFVALANGASHMLLDDGAHFSLADPKLQELRRLIEEARGLSDSPAAPLRISRYQAGLWSELVALGVVGEQAQAWRRQVDALLGLEALSEHRPPRELNAELRHYQRDGFGWLASLWELELGGILADDMGLGKTLQALALVCHARSGGGSGGGAASGRDGPFLVVAPTSVVSNWVTEAARFAPSLTVNAITDTLAKSGRSIAEVAAADLVVTSYTLFRLEAEAYRAVPWAGLILDEAQYVKNHQAKTYRCARQLEAGFKLAITGTPMENNLMELWSLLSITAPGLFPDPKRFSEQYARPIERGGDRERLARLRRRIRPLVKRRTKELVAAELPAKQEQTLELDLHPRHRKLYETHLQRERQKVLGLLGELDRNRFTILRSITLLRQLSLHPGLLDVRHDPLPCVKLDALVEQLEDVVGGGHRALVFSQFTGFLARVRERLDRERIGYRYLDGRTRSRSRVIDQFKRGCDPVFLISLKAGGFGLNLTEADYCFLLDPWWNPATENQAIDRTHRIGQTRPVMVYRLIARGTIEEKVLALARRKARLFSGVMDDGEMFASRLTADDIRGLFE